MCPNCKREDIFFYRGFWRTFINGEISGKIRHCECGCDLFKYTEKENNPSLKKGEKVKVGVYLKRKTKDHLDEYASDRIRGEWLVKYWPDAEIYNPKNDYEVIIFHSPDFNILNNFKGKKIADICDPCWIEEPVLLDFYRQCDALVVCTQALKDELIKLVDKPIFVIGDGHDFDEYPPKKHHIGKAEWAVWFGFSQNAHSFSHLIDQIKKAGLKLKVISQDNSIYPLNIADNFIKWDRKTAFKEIGNCDLAVLPKNGIYKSDNKTITAQLCGLPVAKDEKDINRFLSAEERNKEISSLKLDNYHIKNRVEDYKKVIENLDKKEFTFYSAICGEFDSKRNDATCFTENNIFSNPVMGAKIYKVLSHKFIRGNNIWLDGNIYPLDKNKIEELLEDYDMAVFSHPERKTIYEEHQPARVRLPENLKHLMDEQIEAYKLEGFDGGKLAECGMIIRRDNEATRIFNNMWWTEICRWQQRDQISFPYVAWKMKDKIKIKYIDGNVRYHPLFKYVFH